MQWEYMLVRRIPDRRLIFTWTYENQDNPLTRNEYDSKVVPGINLFGWLNFLGQQELEGWELAGVKVTVELEWGQVVTYTFTRELLKQKHRDIQPDYEN